MTINKVAPRVFVSSVVDGFSAFREAARRGIKEAGGKPTLVNEDFPSMSSSSRNACLDAIDSCDIYLAVIGERGGWQTPSGKLVVEEEYDHARAKGMQTLVFLQDVDRDSDADQLAAKMSDYITGNFRVTFDAPEQLENEVKQALTSVIDSYHLAPTDMKTVDSEVNKTFPFSNAGNLRFVVAPARTEEVVGPVKLESDEFLNQIYEIGHDPNVRLFSYQKSKENSIEGDALVIQQLEASNQRGVKDTRVEIQESGCVIVDINLTAYNSSNGYRGISGMTISLVNVQDYLQSSFRFASKLLDVIDEYERHVQFVYNVSLQVGRYTVVEQSNLNQKTMQMSFHGRNQDPVVALKELRNISRNDLRNPDSETERVIARIRRQTSK